MEIKLGINNDVAEIIKALVAMPEIVVDITYPIDKNTERFIKWMKKNLPNIVIKAGSKVLYSRSITEEFKSTYAAVDMEMDLDKFRELIAKGVIKVG
jgi:beta-lactamase class D